MAQQLQPLDTRINIGHGHTETHVVLQFNARVAELYLDPEQARSLVKAVSESLELLAAHQEKKRRGLQS